MVSEAQPGLINNLILLRDDILLLLPPETEALTRTQQSGLEVATLQSQTYNPVYGTVIKHSNQCKRVIAGDKAFFQIFTFSVAKDRAYGDETNPQFVNEYIPVQHFAFKENDNWYLIIRESALYFLVGEVPPGIQSLNNYVIATPAPNNSPPYFQGGVPAGRGGQAADNSQLITLTKHNKSYALNEAIVFASETLQPGDCIQTLRHCDITIEEQFNNPILSALIPPSEADGTFIIEFKNIISIRMADNTYQAGHKRIIVKPDEINTETASGLITLETARAKLLTGKVVSVGKECADWREGDTVLYARNSGMPIPHEDGDLLVLQDIDVFAKIVTQ